MLVHKRFVASLAFALVTAFTCLTLPGTSLGAGLVIYSTTPNETAGQTYVQQTIDVRILDSLVGQVRHDYTVVADSDLHQATLAKYQYVIYLGAGQKRLSPTLVDAVDRYKGPFYAFYANADQFTKKLPWLKVHGLVRVDKVEPVGRQSQDLSDMLTAGDGAGDPPRPTGYLANADDFWDVRGDGAEVTLRGNRVDGKGSVPLALHSGHDYYFAGANIRPPVDGYVTESLLDFFGEKGQGFIKYLRLEDVSPLSDPQELMEQAKFLKEERIPYMVAVIPVYQYGDGAKVHLDARPDVVKALQYMQANGASIVMHGYKHKFRAEETGEGFEFWDAKNDRPILEPEDAKPKFRSDFATEAEWEAYVKAGATFERSYIEDALRRGVQELVANGLYPVAFEPPHYAISQLGYRVVAEHFSSFVGQTQMSDTTWNSGYVPPWESRPTFLHGMTLYPETLGFLSESDPQFSLSAMQERLVSRGRFSQAYLSAFYHPYLGLAGLKKVAGLLDSVHGTWLNLKERHNLVQVVNIRISTEGGRIHVEQPSFPRFASAYARNLWIRRHLPWAIPIILGLLTAAGFLVIRREIRQEV